MIRATRDLLGRFDLVFEDGSEEVVTLLRDANHGVFQWGGQAGLPCEHAVRQINDNGWIGWIRELKHVFQKSIKSYGFDPAAGRPLPGGTFNPRQLRVGGTPR